VFAASSVPMISGENTEASITVNNVIKNYQHFPHHSSNEENFYIFYKKNLIILVVARAPTDDSVHTVIFSSFYLKKIISWRKMEHPLGVLSYLPRLPPTPLAPHLVEPI